MRRLARFAQASRGAYVPNVTAIQTILCAVDFSEPSEAAAAYAAGLARQTGASLHLLHAFQIPMLALPDGAVLPSPEWTVSASTKLQEGLDQIAEGLEGVEARTHLVEGQPHTEVERFATEHDVDLVVLGTHGRTGLAHLFLGSVAERIVRTSSVPVITVPDRARAADRSG